MPPDDAPGRGEADRSTGTGTAVNSRLLIAGLVAVASGVLMGRAPVERLLWAMTNQPSQSAGGIDTALYTAGLLLPLLTMVAGAGVGCRIGARSGRRSGAATLGAGVGLLCGTTLLYLIVVVYVLLTLSLLVG